VDETGIKLKLGNWEENFILSEVQQHGTNVNFERGNLNTEYMSFSPSYTSYAPAIHSLSHNALPTCSGSIPYRGNSRWSLCRGDYCLWWWKGKWYM